MPSLFPELFNFSFMAPFALRIALGATLANSGFNKILRKNKISQKVFGGIVFLSGLFLVAGLFTQVVSLAISLIIIIDSVIYYKQGDRNLSEMFIKLAIAVSLILTGPGMFAFDLPL